MRRASKRRILVVILVLVLIAITAVSTFYIYRQELAGIESRHGSEIIELENQIDELESRKKASVLVFNKDLLPGHEITTDDLMTVLIDPAIKPSDCIIEKDLVLGKRLKVASSMYTYVSSPLLYQANKIDHDLRELEFNYLFVPRKASQGDYVDLRIKFPSGQDYIVLSKKMITDIERLYSQENNLQEETLWMHLNEEEIIRIGSAVVDAYLNKAQLYIIEYVEPSIQDPSAITYPENFPVLEMISMDQGLISQAQAALLLEKRTRLENSLKDMFASERIDFDAPDIEVAEVVDQDDQSSQTIKDTSDSSDTNKTSSDNNFD